MPFPAQSVQVPTGFQGQTLPNWISALERLQEKTPEAEAEEIRQIATQRAQAEKYDMAYYVPLIASTITPQLVQDIKNLLETNKGFGLQHVSGAKPEISSVINPMGYSEGVGQFPEPTTTSLGVDYATRLSHAIFSRILQGFNRGEIKKDDLASTTGVVASGFGLDEDKVRTIVRELLLTIDNIGQTVQTMNVS